MANRRVLAKNRANSSGRRKRPDAGPGRFSSRTLTAPKGSDSAGMGLRASKLRGRQWRLQARIEATPRSKVPSDLDFKNYTYRKPGSLNVRSR